MKTLSMILLLFSLLLTVPLFPLVDGIRRLAGPDRSGADLQYFMVCGPRWILMAVVLLGLVSHGSFGWIHPSRGVQQGVVFLAHVAMGIASLGALLAARHDSPLVRNSWVLLSVGAPAVVMAFAVADWNPEALAVPPRLVRGALLSAAAAGGIALVAGSIGTAVSARGRARERARGDAEKEKLHEEQRAHVNALAPDAPLVDWFRWTYWPAAEDVQGKAWAGIRRHPRLRSGLAHVILSEDRWAAFEAMSFLAHLTPPPPEAAEAVRARFRKLIQETEALASAPPEQREQLFEREERVTHGFTCAMNSVREAGIDLRPELRAMAALAAPVEAAVKSPPGRSSRAYYLRSGCEEQIRDWEKR